MKNKPRHSSGLYINRKEFLDTWLTDIQSNTDIQKDDYNTESDLICHSKDLFQTILSTFETVDLPDIDTTAMKPLLQLWHKILKSNIKQGYSTQKTAMLLFSLKSSLNDYFSSSKSDSLSQAECHQLSRLIDMLSFLTFEVYSHENDKRIQQRDAQIGYLQKNQAAQKLGPLVSQSPKMIAVIRSLGLILENDVSILLNGESGTGKDFIATTIHDHSTRAKHPFVPINCAAIPNELLESELFGYEEGSFTGAGRQKVGKFELASGGTLFLDEIGDMSPSLQTKLLRVLQNRQIERIGGTSPIPIDVRIIAATHRDLEKDVAKGVFRLDLFYRLNVYPLTLPALRDRKEDIIALAHSFMDHYTAHYQLPPTALTDDGAHYLRQHTWPGNIRELQNCIQRALIMAQGQPLSAAVFELKPGFDADHRLSLLEAPSSSPEPDILPLALVEKTAIKTALSHTKGNIRQAASALKVSRTTLYNKIKKYDLHSFLDSMLAPSS